MKRIIVISDTHMPKRGKVFPKVLEEQFKIADLIIHAGDIQTMEVYQMLQAYAPVLAVYGNVDDEDLRKELPLKELMTIEGVRIGLIHGHGKGKTTKKRVVDAFKDEDVDLVIFGHSHIPILEKQEDRWLFNPGSPNDKRRQPQFSFGILIIHNSQFDISHCYF